MNPTSVSQFQSEFDPFLYASVDEGGSGALLSVLSALARLDIDPWQEAANLARMSRESAVQRLTSLIAILPGKPLMHLDCSAVAARLVLLLPRQSSIPAALPGAVTAAAMATNMRALMYLAIINLIFMALAFGGQYLADSHRPAADALAAIGEKPAVHMPLPRANQK